MFRYYLYKIGKFLVLNFPRSFVYGLAHLISDLHYYLHFVDRRNVKKNLLRVTQSRENLNRIAHDMFRNFGIYLLEFFLMNQMVDEKFLKENIVWENLDRLKAVINEGRGGILLTGHIGNWELGGMILSELGYPITVIALPHKNVAVNNFFNEQRENKGKIAVVPTSKAARRCLNLIRQNQLVALVGDRDFFDQGEEVPFLDQTAMMPKGPAFFSLRTGAPIIPMFLLRTGREKYTLKIMEAIYPPALSADESKREEEIKSLINQYVPVIESIIKQYPSQWLMFRDFAKSSV